MMCLAVGIAVTALLSFHIYLILTSQTTIEFHGNLMKRRVAKENGTVWHNPYNLGWKRNLEQVWGSIRVSPSGNNRKSKSVFERSSDVDDVNGRLFGIVLFIFRVRQVISFLLLLLPSTREPEFLPVPMKGDLGRRTNRTNKRFQRKESLDDFV